MLLSFFFKHWNQQIKIQYQPKSLNRQVSGRSPQKLATPRPSYLIKLYIRPEQEVELTLTSISSASIDSIIQECIQKYKLKKQAHGYLKQQINNSIRTAESCRRFKTQNSNDSTLAQFLYANNNPLKKKQGILRDLKIGDIDKNRITVQRTPKNAENIFFKKESHMRQAKNIQKSFNLGLKKTQSQKQNIETLFFGKSSNQLNSKSKSTRSDRKSMPLHKSAEKTKKDSKDTVVIKTDQEIQKLQFQFLETDELFSPVKQLRLKTQSSLECGTKLKELSLQDLQKEMNEQMQDLKYGKKIKRLQPQLCNLFRSIIRYNPPKLNKIDPRYACFEDLSDKTIQSLHQFLMNLKDDQLNSLDFQNFKKYLIKYRGQSLIQSIR